MAIINECIAVIKELIPHFTKQHQLKNLVELQTAACVSGDDKTYLDEAVAALVFQQCTGITTNAKTRKALYDYQQSTGIRWRELELCYRRLLTPEGKMRAPVRKDYYRPWIVCLTAILFFGLIGAGFWFGMDSSNLIVLIAKGVLLVAVGFAMLSIFTLAVDITDALGQISKKHQTII